MRFLLLAACALAADPATKPPLTPGKAGIEWVNIPGGSFAMGDDYGTSDERPAHRVTLKSFEIARTEVTNKQYRACVKAGACTPPDPDCMGPGFDGEEQPVVCVDWHQAEEFSRWAGGRLPSEAEWEYAARSAGKRRLPWGDEQPDCRRTVIFGGGYGCGRNTTWEVCSRPQGNTEQGLCDMVGNVAQWVLDFKHPDYVGAPADGHAWDDPPSPVRVARGASWLAEAVDARATRRLGAGPRLAFRGLGFRPAR